MKKIFKVITVFFVAIILVACSSSNSITPTDLDKKIEAKETFIVVVSSSTCSYCKMYKPIVEEFVKKNSDVKLNEIVIDKLSNQDEKIAFLDKYSITGTPTTLFFKDGKLVTMVSEVISIDKLNELYTKYLK